MKLVHECADEVVTALASRFRLLPQLALLIWRRASPAPARKEATEVVERCGGYRSAADEELRHGDCGQKKNVYDCLLGPPLGHPAGPAVHR
ncbi:uncharacterized protein A4U43_C03F19260 [Asparagus officinalis]|uniref:Uncharacterized protein n=1 Tax=Asparagus officinalis TaxID=4686 RepID=A0A5P1FBD8_ASPOF|nr:uncharacterized protein A4U43_C03F19260 [Asparagus officinalis]